jgi:hypothetical protein
VSLRQITQMVDFAARTFVVIGGTGLLGGKVANQRMP